MITFYQRTISKTKAKTLDEFRVGSWVCVEDPNEAEIARLVEEFDLDEGYIRDALDPHEVPRAEKEGEMLYIFARIPYGTEDAPSSMPLLIVIGKNFFMTVSQKKLPFLEKFLSDRVPIYTTQKTRLFLQIFSEINQSYSMLISRVNRRVRGMSATLEKVSTKDIAQFVRYETALNDHLSALVPMNAALNTLLHGRVLKLYEEDEDLVEDLSLANIQLIEICRANLKNIVNVREAYSTLMTHELNSSIRLLTVLTVALAVPTLISSIFGMNVPFPFPQSDAAFWVILFVILVLASALLFWFIKNRWV